MMTTITKKEETDNKPVQGQVRVNPDGTIEVSFTEKDEPKTEFKAPLRVVKSFKEEYESDLKNIPQKLSELEGIDKTARLKLRNYYYGFVEVSELDGIIQDLTGNENHVSRGIYYCVAKAKTRILVTDEFEMIRESFTNDGYAIKYYDRNTGDLKGFVVLDAKTVNGLLFVEKDRDCYSLDAMYEDVVSNMEEDIQFQHMLYTLI